VFVQWTDTWLFLLTPADVDLASTWQVLTEIVALLGQSASSNYISVSPLLEIGWCPSFAMILLVRFPDKCNPPSSALES
jgi:hypothetical protein